MWTSFVCQSSLWQTLLSCKVSYDKLPAPHLQPGFLHHYTIRKKNCRKLSKTWRRKKKIVYTVVQGQCSAKKWNTFDFKGLTMCVSNPYLWLSKKLLQLQSREVLKVSMWMQWKCCCSVSLFYVAPAYQIWYSIPDFKKCT